MVTRRAGTLLVFLCALLPLIIAFRLAGAVRIKESLSAIQRNLAIARESKENQKAFEEMQLRLREAVTFNQSWRAIRRAARRLDFSKVTMEFGGLDGTAYAYTWRSVVNSPTRPGIVSVTIAEGRFRNGLPFHATIDVAVNGSLESAGHRVALFGRLLDENSLPSPDVLHEGRAEGESG